MRLLAPILRYAASFSVLVLVWQLVVLALALPTYILPAPGDVGAVIYTDAKTYASAAVVTFSNAIIGATLGIASAIIIGCSLGFWRRARWLGEPYLVVFQSFPRESLFPLLIVWFGFGMETKVAAAVLLSFFPVALLTLQAVTNTKNDYLELFESWGGSRFDEYWHCRLPCAIPRIIAAIKIGLPLALIGAVLGELFGSTNGLGYIIISSGSQFRVDRIFGAATLLAMFGVLQFGCIQLLEATVFKKYFRDH